MRNIWDLVTGRKAPVTLKQVAAPPPSPRADGAAMLNALANRGNEINRLVRESSGTHGEVQLRHRDPRVKGAPMVVDPNDMTAISAAMR